MPDKLCSSLLNHSAYSQMRCTLTAASTHAARFRRCCHRYILTPHMPTPTIRWDQCVCSQLPCLALIMRHRHACVAQPITCAVAGKGSGLAVGTATSPKANTLEWPWTRSVASVHVEPRSSDGNGSFRGFVPAAGVGALPAVHMTRSAGRSCTQIFMSSMKQLIDAMM